MARKPALSLAAVPGRRRATLELAQRISGRARPGIGWVPTMARKSRLPAAARGRSALVEVRAERPLHWGHNMAVDSRGNIYSGQPQTPQKFGLGELPCRLAERGHMK